MQIVKPVRASSALRCVLVLVLGLAAVGAAHAQTWTTIADQWLQFTLTGAGTQTVRYGTGTIWLQKNFTAGTYYCTNDVFGSDPAVGLDKHCELLSGSAGLPAVPVSPVPVVNYEYDANGNPTKTVQAPGVSGFAFATSATYDTLDRRKDTTDAKTGKTQFAYDGLDRNTRVTDPRNLVTQTPRNGLGDVTQLVSPDTGTEAAARTYDAGGNLKTRTDSRGVLATYSYDALNRATSVVYSLSGSTSLTYSWGYDLTGANYSNGIGRLTRTDHPAGSSRYLYDPQGRLTQYVQNINAATGANPASVLSTTSYGRDVAGHITSITYPSGRVLSLTYANGLPTALGLKANTGATAQSLLTGIQFSPFGGVQSWSWAMTAGPQAVSRVYDTSGRLVRYPLGSLIRDVSYDAGDRITGYKHYDASSAAAQPAFDQTFTYDELGRLTGIIGSPNWTINYDANGNRTSVMIDTTTNTYTTSTTSNRLLSITNPARTLTPDAAGNTTQDTNPAAPYTATYNLAGRLATHVRAGVTTTYTYDSNGQRVRKASSSGAAATVIYVYDLDGHLIGEYNQTGVAIREYAWLGDMPVAVFTPDPANAANPPLIYFIHTDHLATPRVVVDRAGNQRWIWLADPFGTAAPNTNPQSIGAFTFPLRFPGQFADSESSLNYNYFRNYDASIGRYSQSDPIGLEGGINTYAYVGGNPLSNVDPNGLQALAGCFGGPVGCALGVGATGASIWMAARNTQSSSPATTTRPEQCTPGCDATSSRNEAMVLAYSWADISIGGYGANPIPWSNFNMPAGMARGGREYGEFMRTYYPKNYGYSTPTGASVVEHPFGHPDQPGPDHHDCPHFHAKNSAGVEKIFTYKAGS